MYAEQELPFINKTKENNLKRKTTTSKLTFISPFSNKGHGCKSFVDFCAALSDVKCAKTSMVYVG